MTKMSTIGLINTTTNSISKGAVFIGMLLMVAGAGGMALSNKQFTETEMKYISEHIDVK
jgi:predicted NUDIX family phosphoesterase